MSAERAATEEQARELRRYHADHIAARLPATQSALAGAVAGVLVFFVPVLIVAGSMLIISFTFSVGVLPLQWLVRVLGLSVSRGERTASNDLAAETARRAVPPRPTEAPLAPVEGPLPDETAAQWVAVALVLFWPLAMLGVGALVAQLYRLRRRRKLDELVRSPLELNIFPEVLLFYLLTAGGGLLVGVGSFVALGANVIFAWAGFLIWRWLFDRFALRLAPPSVRAEADAAVQREKDYRRRLRESG